MWHGVNCCVYTGNGHHQCTGPRRPEETHQELQDEHRERAETACQGAERAREASQEEVDAVAGSYPT